MATLTKTNQTSKEAAPKSSIPALVAGYTVLENGSIAIIVKDKVSKNPLLSTKGVTHTGTLWAAKGSTIEEVKEAFPRGSSVAEVAAWGAPKEDLKFEGVFEMEEV